MLELAHGFLERKGLGEARREAELLVAHALGLDRLGLYMRLDQPIQKIGLHAVPARVGALLVVADAGINDQPFPLGLHHQRMHAQDDPAIVVDEGAEVIVDEAAADAPPSVPLTITGNVLTNDIQGADDNLMVVSFTYAGGTALAGDTYANARLRPT